MSPSVLSHRVVLGVAAALFVGVNFALILLFQPWEYVGRFDWLQWQELPEALAGGYLYDLEGHLPYVYSPIAAPFLAVIPIIGAAGWIALNLASLLLLRDRVLVIAAVLSWAFWTSTLVGNVVVFIFVAGALAYRGNRAAALLYLSACLLMPRPVQMPLAVWLLWQNRTLWRPFAALFVAHGLAVLATGYADDWVRSAFSYASVVGFDLGPTYLLGTAWLIVGIPLGVWLTLRGHVGWAGLSVSPYILEHYYLMPLIELRAPNSNVQQQSDGD